MHTVHDLDLDRRRALLRVDFNVPKAKDGGVADDLRIRAALPTIRFVRERGGACVLMSHWGRPGGQPEADRRMGSIGACLQALLDGVPVQTCEGDDVAGVEARQKAEALGPGDVLLLQNLRFDPGEKRGDATFARRLAGLGDVYVNDAFGACHRAHASTATVARLFDPDRRAIGLLVARELEAIDQALEDPDRPFVAVLGGAKIGDKVPFVRALLDRADRLLVGGALAYTFLKARGDDVGDSKVEEDVLDTAREILEVAGERLQLPTDHVVAESEDPDGGGRWVEGSLPDGAIGYDIGTGTSNRYRDEIEAAKTVLWNGPMGLFEQEAFAAGSVGIAKAMANCDGHTLVGGGETAQLVHDLDLGNAMSHVSTGGGAFIHYVAYRKLPALDALDGA